MSKDLKKRGFTFVGSTICYAMMQATGLVNDPSGVRRRHTPYTRDELDAFSAGLRDVHPGER